MDENIILIDWLSITSHELDEFGFQLLLGMEEVPWELTTGAKGYKDRLYFGGISIHYNGRDDMGVWCELCGQGCRTFESLGHGNYQKLFNFVSSGRGNITRLDIAYDDHTGVLDIDQIVDDTMNQRFVSKSRYWKVEISSVGKTVYHGSPKSDTQMRIYDKAAERHCSAGTHWVRVEFELRRERAKKFISMEEDIGYLFAGVVCNYLRYVIPEESDSNRWRWPLTPYWGELLCGANAISLYEKPGMEYNLDRCENYVYKFAGNAIDALIQIYGEKTFMAKLRERNTRKNPKYEQLVTMYKDFVI